MTLFKRLWCRKQIVAGLCLLLQASGLGGISAAKSAEPNLRPLQFSLDFVGMHTLSPTRHWPDVQFGSIRPAGTSWGALEPAKGQFDWHSLDTWVAQSQSHHVQLDYVFVNTPQWASTRPNETASARSLAVPHLPTWMTGQRLSQPSRPGIGERSPAMNYGMSRMHRDSGPALRSRWWNWQPMRIRSSSRLTRPQSSLHLQYHPPGGRSLTRSGLINILPPVVVNMLMRSLGTAMPDGTTDRHCLLRNYRNRSGLSARVLAKHNLAQMPIWNTEGGWGKDAQLPDENAQAAFLTKWYLINFTNGIARAYWYQWDNAEWGTLWRDGSGVTPAGKAAQQIIAWLGGTTAAAPCRLSQDSKIWECDLQKGSRLYRVVWSSSAESTFSNVAGAVSITTLDGSRNAADRKPITVTSQPLLLEYSETK